MIIEKDFNSTAIKHIKYDSVKGLLKITFTSSDKAYDYPDVPSELVDGLIKAESVGRYFNKNIKAYALTLL